MVARGRMVGVAATVVVASVLAGGAAFADPVDSGFTSATTTFTTYLGEAAVFVVTIAGFAIGILLLRRWMKRAAGS